jgi:hypothetical protein
MTKSSFKTFGFWYTSSAAAIGVLTCLLSLMDRYTVDHFVWGNAMGRSESNFNR